MMVAKGRFRVEPGSRFDGCTPPPIGEARAEGMLNLYGLSELFGFKTGIQCLLNLRAPCKVGFSRFSGLDGGDEALIDAWCFRGLDGFPCGLVDISAEADLEFVVGFV